MGGILMTAENKKKLVWEKPKFIFEYSNTIKRLVDIRSVCSNDCRFHYTHHTDLPRLRRQTPIPEQVVDTSGNTVLPALISVKDKRFS